jgi:RNA polymerase sigma-70 factor (ECF subfamily)
MPTLKDETLLLKEVAAGNEAAFKQLFEERRDKLFNYLVRITKSKEIAEEIIIDVFLKLWIGRELVHDIKNLDGFLHKVAYYKALDFLKKAGRSANLQQLIYREMQMVREKEADHRLLDHEYRQILHKAIRQLSPQRKLVFTLSRENGLSHDEIARQLKLSRQTVKNTITDALKFIRDFLQAHQIDGLVLLYLLILL